ncbi:MAG: DHHA2 domain-containing protein [Sedimenticola sp.]
MDLVTSYPNPDLDGIASMISRAWMLQEIDGIAAEAVYSGELDKETEFVLERLGIPSPRQVSACPPDHPVHLVDTHHLIQLSGHVSPKQVRSIIDHHPAGDSTSFPHAKITNDLVGAAATLIEEQLWQLGVSIPPQMARLLHAAILSNTLHYSAPTTTRRDREAADRLEEIAPLPTEFPREMVAARSGVSDKTTPELLAMDYKDFDLGTVIVGISQLELGAAELVLDRADLEQALKQFEATRSKADFVFLSVVDIIREDTTVVAVSHGAQQAVSSAIGIPFNGTRMHCNRILLRKSDFVPQLKSLLREGMPEDWREWQ